MKQYIGDGVYVDYDGFAFVLTTENGISVMDRIVLEPDVYNSLVAYVQRLDSIAESTDALTETEKP